MKNAKETKQRQRLLALGAIVLLFCAFFLGMWATDPYKKKPSFIELREQKKRELKKNYEIRPGDYISHEENWISKSEKEMSNLIKENKSLKKSLEQVNDKLAFLMEQNEKKSKESPKKVKNNPLMNRPLPPVKPPQKKPFNMAGAILPPQLASPFPSLGQKKKADPIPPIQEISLDDEEGRLPSAKGSLSSHVSHYLPASSFATVVLMSGVDAPTGGMAEENPVPIILKVMDKGQLPNLTDSDIKDCHVVGAVVGNLSSERGNIRLERISCVLKNGSVIEGKLKGVVTGEDGKAGFRGRVVSKQGSLIAKSALAGIFSGMGSAISQQYQQVASSALGTVQTMQPDKIFQSGLAKGTSNALEKIADFYIARANETYPIIEIDAGRIGELVLTAGTQFTKKFVGKTNHVAKGH